MSRSVGVIAPVLLLLVCLVATAPARPGAGAAGRQVMQGFQWHHLARQASRCLVHTPAGYLHLGAVGWQLDPLSLMTVGPAGIESSVESQALATLSGAAGWRRTRPRCANPATYRRTWCGSLCRFRLAGGFRCRQTS